MRAEDGDSLRRLHGFRGAHREPQPVDVVEQPRDRRARRAGHELVGHVEQRGDGVEVLGGPQSGLAAPLPRAEQPARQTAALPHLPQRRARIGRTTRGALQHGAHAAQRPRVWRGKPVGQPVCATPTTSRSPNSRGGTVESSRRNARRSWRSVTGSTRPMGPVSSSSACVAVRPCAVAASAVSSARTTALSGSGASIAGGATGTPAAVSARGRPAPARGTERTITAICDHGTSSTRWARRSVSATTAASACSDAARTAATEPSGPSLGR